MKKLTKNCLKGEIKNFPLEVVEKMRERQVEQTGKSCIEEFQKNKKVSLYNGRRNGGFNWDRTGKHEEGFWFWYLVISEMKFDVFFAKYPLKS